MIKLASRRFAHLPAILLAIGLIASLGACETLGLKSSSKDKTVDVACPPVEVPPSLATMVKDGVSGALRVTGSKCDVSDDSVTMKVNLDLTAKRGASVKQTELSLPFFAAITDQNDQLLNKKLYETTFNFSDDTATDHEELTLTFKLTKAQASTTKVTVGYQLSRDTWQKLKP